MASARGGGSLSEEGERTMLSGSPVMMGTGNMPLGGFPSRQERHWAQFGGNSKSDEGNRPSHWRVPSFKEGIQLELLGALLISLTTRLFIDTNIIPDL